MMVAVGVQFDYRWENIFAMLLVDALIDNLLMILREPKKKLQSMRIRWEIDG